MADIDAGAPRGQKGMVGQGLLPSTALDTQEQALLAITDRLL